MIDLLHMAKRSLGDLLMPLARALPAEIQGSSWVGPAPTEPKRVVRLKRNRDGFPLVSPYPHRLLGEVDQSRA
jgi:hypothetical protein